MDVKKKDKRSKSMKKGRKRRMYGEYKCGKG